MHLYRKRGTLGGLSLALNIATGGAVDSGEIVIVEDWRLRRTFSTILGMELAQTEDPLLGGLSVSGNSYVGDTLFLGDEGRKKEVLTIFAPELARSDASDDLLHSFFDELAYRATILVHQDVDPQDLGLVRRVVALEQPAHVSTRVAVASEPLLVGMASLVGVDTYLVQESGPQPVTVDRSRLGVRDRLQGGASLDPRFRGGVTVSSSASPLADAGPDQAATLGRSFRLDGGRSRAAPGHTITRYVWRRIE
jgi:hypothetical protein